MKRSTRVHKDCPFTLDEISEFQSALYNVNTSFHCCNTPVISWYKGYSNFQLKNSMVEKKHNIDVIHLMITRRCDHKCELCYNKKCDISALPLPSNEELNQINTLCLTGGEPFLLAVNLDKVARMFKQQHRNIKKIYVYTSGAAMVANFPRTLKYIDGIYIAPKNSTDWSILSSINRADAKSLSILRGNRLYVFKEQIHNYNKFKDIAQKLNLDVVYRFCDKEFSVPNNEIFRKLLYFDM